VSDIAECPTCHGTGVVEEYRGPAGHDREVEVECPDCQGMTDVDDRDPDDRPLPTEDETGLRDPYERSEQ
jgi:endogenous inhibitor of DNA gyrase (YacG/DUF329 family)